ncbi:MAG: PAS domain S-box protein [Elusimicrobia bacterium]|nr:PAS domain S-box protein [Elusimicrobiota bacterium]
MTKRKEQAAGPKRAARRAPAGAAGKETERDLFRLIAENLTDMVAVLDLKGKRLYCSPSYRLVGDPAKLRGTISFNDIAEEHREKVKKLFFESIQTGLGRNTEYRLRVADGSSRDIESHGIVVKDASGKPVNVIIVSRDVTERNALQRQDAALKEQLQQSDKLNSLGMSLSGVAHELNNPLTSVMGFCQLLLADEGIQGNTRYREDLETIFKEAQRCQKIVKNISTFARQHKPEKAFIGINGVLHDILRVAEHQLRTRDITLELALADDLPKTMADYHQLQQVLVNLINNAQDAMDDRQGVRTLTLRTWSEADAIRIAVEDIGPGIRPEHLSRIFEPFFTTKQIGKGTGLGLAISFGIVAEHGGRIWAENRREGGARFVVELPILDAPGAPADAASPAGHPAVPVAPGTRVLVIDDEQTILDLIVRMLRNMKLVPDVARNADMAKKKLSGSSYGAVICDYRLPGMSGFDIFEWVRTAKPELVSRWIFLTGSINPVELETTGKPILRKPFEFSVFESAVRAALKS